jgi:hypothetical protein
MISIEKDVPYPMPKIRKRKLRIDRGTRLVLPLKDMQVGDSIYVPDAIMSRKSAQISASKYAGDYGWKFRTKPEAGGCRIWRLA